MTNTPEAPEPAPLAEFHLIIQSGLPADTQSALISYAQQRRAAMEAAIFAETQLLIEQIRNHTNPARSARFE